MVNQKMTVINTEKYYYIFVLITGFLT